MGWKETNVKAERHLAKQNRDLKRLIKLAGPCDIRARRNGTDFEVLARGVVYQQLAGAAAATIHDRIIEAVGGAVTPESIARTRSDKLRKAGLSASKLGTLKGLSLAVLEGQIDLAHVRRLSDEEIRQQLTTVKGIGPWTVNMFLMFRLGRLDVWPTTDYGVRNGFARLIGRTDPVPVNELESLGDPYRPYRSILAWYCWRAIDLRFVSE